MGFYAWILLLVFGSEGVSRQKAGGFLGFTSSASLLSDFTVLCCPVGEYLETVVSCGLLKRGFLDNDIVAISV